MVFQSQWTYLPIGLLPNTIELSLVDEATDLIVSNLGNAGFAVANASSIRRIQQVQVKCDHVTLDSGLNELNIQL